MKSKNEVISEECSLCGNISSFDKQSLKASTVTVNGCNVVMCCGCEDEMFHKLLVRRMPKKKFEQLIFICAMDEKEDLMDLYYKRY
jgi:uncharacterized protein YlaI